jgi:hypothetical protein
MEVQAASQNSLKLLDWLCTEIRVRHYSIRTEDLHVDWARRFNKPNYRAMVPERMTRIKPAGRQIDD